MIFIIVFRHNYLYTNAMKKILVIDDSMTSRFFVNQCLQDRFEVLQADGGKAALALLEGEMVDLVFLDLLMPDMNGFETLEQLQDRYPDLPVFILSADVQHSTLERVLKAGAEGMINKPPKKEKLLEAAATVFGTEE